MNATKSDDRRAAIIERLADHVLAHGLIASSLRPLAKAAGTSDRMLLYYFTDKADIIAATLQKIAERLVVLLMEVAAPGPLPLPALKRHYVSFMFEDRFWPYMCVWLELASRAGRGDPLYMPIAAQIGQGFLALGASQLQSDNRESDAARLLVAIEGMVLIHAIGLPEVVADSLGAEGAAR